jgi:hypothetical protein
MMTEYPLHAPRPFVLTAAAAELRHAEREGDTDGAARATLRSAPAAIRFSREW